MPLVTVIIPTFNRSGVLRFAVLSALKQTLQDIEILVIGDGCTDDSEQVVASFADSRLRWYNLPENSGGQSVPNNTGLAMARGRYVAYLGHDDLWLAHHLETLVAAIEGEQADLVFSIGIWIGLPGTGVRKLSGLSPTGHYEPRMPVPPSTVLHTKEMMRDVQPWQDYRTSHVLPDTAFLVGAFVAGKRLVPVRKASVLKFSAAWRQDVYKTLPSYEQADYAKRMESESDFLATEMTAVALAYAEGKTETCETPNIPPGSKAGWQMEQVLRFKGIEPTSKTVSGSSVQPVYCDQAALGLWNQSNDIVSAEGVSELKEGRIPARCALLGRGWYDLERVSGEPMRWVNTDAEVILTRPGNEPIAIVMEIESGPGMGCIPFELCLHDEGGKSIGAATVSYRHYIRFELSALHPEGAVFRLVAPGGGTPAGSDPRLLNFRVFRFFTSP